MKKKVCERCASKKPVKNSRVLSKQPGRGTKLILSKYCGDCYEHVYFWVKRGRPSYQQEM